jgi:hypothetical protein
VSRQKDKSRSPGKGEELLSLSGAFDFLAAGARDGYQPLFASNQMSTRAAEAVAPCRALAKYNRWRDKWEQPRGALTLRAACKIEGALLEDARDVRVTLIRLEITPRMQYDAGAVQDFVLTSTRGLFCATPALSTSPDCARRWSRRAPQPSGTGGSLDSDSLRSSPHTRCTPAAPTGTSTAAENGAALERRAGARLDHGFVPKSPQAQEP